MDNFFKLVVIFLGIVPVSFYWENRKKFTEERLKSKKQVVATFTGVLTTKCVHYVWLFAIMIMQVLSPSDFFRGVGVTGILWVLTLLAKDIADNAPRIVKVIKDGNGRYSWTENFEKVALSEYAYQHPDFTLQAE